MAPGDPFYRVDVRKRGRLVSLTDERIAITGTLDDVCADVAALIRRAGATYQNKVNSHTTILVQGRPSPVYSHSDPSGERYGQR